MNNEPGLPKYRLFFLIAIVSMVAPARAQVVINELMYHPLEPFGTTNESEFVELYNAGSQAVDLSDYRFDNGVDFDFPAGTLLATGAYLVVCEHLETFTNTYPTVTQVVGQYSGALNNGGERVTLSRRENGEWVEVDSIRYVDFGPSDGAGPSLELVHPGFARDREQFMEAWRDSLAPTGTPGAVNSVYDAQPAPAIGEVSHEPPLGIPGSIITVRARVTDAGPGALQSVMLQYRKDARPKVAWSSVPMYDHGLLGDTVPGDGSFAAEIPGAGHPALQAGDNLEFQIVATNSLAKLTTSPSGSRSGVLSGPYSYLCPYVDDPGYDGEYRTFHMVMTEENRTGSSGLERRGNDSNVLLDCTFITAAGEILYNCGIRYRGLSSRVRPYNYRIEFPKGQRFLDYQEINFNHKEPLLQHMGMRILGASGNGVVAPETRLVRLWLNEDLRSDELTTNSGNTDVYVMVEKIGSDFIRKHYDDATGNIYRGNRDGDLSYEAVLADYEDHYLIDIGNPFTAWLSLQDLTDVLAQPVAQYPTILSNRVNIVQWAQSYASNVAIENSEGGLLCARSTTGDDYYMYADPSDGQFDFLPWDMDSCLDSGRNAVSATRSMWQFESNGKNASAEVRKFLTNPPIAPLYVGFLLETLDGAMSEEAIDALFDDMGSAISSSYRNHLRNDLATRRASLRSQINTNLTVNISGALWQDSAYAVVNSASLSLSGEGPQGFTTAIEINGQATDWSTRDGDWSTSTDVVLTNVVNHLRIEAVNGGQARDLVVLLQTNVVPAPSMITTPTTWSNPGGTVHLAGDVVVTNGATLAVGAGTTVTFDDGVALRVVAGTLDLQGTATDPVWLLPEDGNAAWSIEIAGGAVATGRHVQATSGSIAVHDGAGLVLEDVRMQEHDAASGLLVAQDAARVELLRSIFSDYTIMQFENTPVMIEGCVFQNMSDNGLRFDGSTATVARTTLRDAVGSDVHGIAVTEGSELVITNCLIQRMSGDGIQIDQAEAGVSHTLIHDCDHGIWAGPGSSLSNQHNTITACATGIYASDAVTPTLQVRNSYLPGTPVLVRVELHDSAGRVAREIWDETATLSVSNPAIALSDNTIALRNGLGSKLITFTGDADFDLTVEVDGMTTSRSLVSWSGAATNTVSGTLAGASTTWSGIVHVTSDLTVPSGHVLTVQPGTLVLLDSVASGTGGTDIDVLGSVQSLGTVNAPVTFTAINPAQEWGEMHHANADPSLYRYTVFTRTGRAPGGGHTGTGPAFRTSDSVLEFDHCSITDLDGKVMQSTSGSDLTFRHCELARAIMGPEVDGTAALVEDTWIYEMRGPDDDDGIYMHNQQAGQDLTLRRVVVAGMDDDGIDTLGAKIYIEDTIVRDVFDKGMSVFGNEVFVDRFLSVNNGKGISVKATGTGIGYVHLNQSTIMGNSIGLQAENKSNQPNVDLQYFVTNSIIEAGPFGGAQPVRTDYDPADIHIAFSDVGVAWPGTGNLNVDPMFVDAANGDFHLQPGSPAAGMGFYDGAAPVPAGPEAEFASILWGNGLSVSGALAMAESDVELPGLDTWPGTGNANRDPFFRDVVVEDFRLQPVSPGIGVVSDGSDWGPVFPVGAHPAAPGFLMLSNELFNATNRITVSWTDRSSDEEQFELERAVEHGPWSSLALLPANTTAFIDDGLQEGTRYRYRVRASHARGSSFFAEAELVTIDGTTTAALKDFLRLTEIMYNPANSPGDVHEFLELQNIGPDPLDLGGLYFANGIDFIFTNGTTLAAGAYFVIARDAVAFSNRYPGVSLDGLFQNDTALNDGGERLRIKNSEDTTILDLTYQDGQSPSWYPTTDGPGYALVLAAPQGDLDQPGSWRAGTDVNGSPGQADPAPVGEGMVINEVLTHTDPPFEDAIEVYNRGTNSIDITGWFLSDDDENLKKYQVTNTVVIPPGGFHVFYAGTSFNADTNLSSSFGLSELGERAFLSSAISNNLTSFRAFQTFGAADKHVSIGRYVRSDGQVEFVAMAERTFGADNPVDLPAFRSGTGLTNSAPRVGPVVINEIMYNPAATGKEFVEIVNISGAPVPLFDPVVPANTWHFDGAFDFVFPEGVTLAPGQVALITSIDPVEYRALFGVTNAVVLGPFSGALNNGGESVELYKPGTQEPGGIVPAILVDRVDYDDQAPWPDAADNGGPSLERIDPLAYGNDPANWLAASVGGTPGAANNGLGLPSIGFERVGDTGLEIGVVVDVSVTLLPQSTSTVTVDYVVGGTATNGVDFQLTAGSLTFWPNETQKTIPLAILDDAEVEVDEDVVVRLLDVSPGGRLGGNDTYTYTIVDTDAAGLSAPTILLSSGPVFTNSIDVTINADPLSEVYYTLDGSVPTRDAIRYEGLFTLTSSARITARRYLGSMNASATDSAVVYKQLTPTFFDGDSDGLDDNWERLYFLSTAVSDGGDDDQDNDRFTDREEMLAGSRPDDPTSLLATGTLFGTGGAEVFWQSELGRQYTVQRASQLAGPWTALATQLDATPPVNSWTDSGVTEARYFYRVLLEP